MCESVLHDIGQSKFDDGKGNQISCSRAKTSMQLKRNNSLTKVADDLKKDSRCRGKAVEIAWKMDGSKDRGVKIEGIVVFLQSSSDCVGKYLPPFEDKSS